MFDRILRLFSATDLIIIGAVLLVAIALIVGNILLVHFYRKHAERKLCTKQLQQRREELLDALEEMKKGGAFAASDEEEKEDDLTEEDVYEDDDKEDEEGNFVLPVEGDEEAVLASAEGADDFDRRLRIIKACDMTLFMREQFSLVGSEFDEKSYYVRYSYSFDAKIRCADERVKERYVGLLNEIALYKGLKVQSSNKQQRIYKGRKTLGLILFRGRTLCIALALDPNEYKNTKYHGIDMSEKKRFKATPMLFKLTSPRKLEYAKYLLTQLSDANTIVMNEHPEPVEVNFDRMNDGELFENDLLKVYVLGEVPQEVLDRLARERAEAESRRLAAQEAAAAEFAQAASQEQVPADEEAPKEEKPKKAKRTKKEKEEE